MAISAARAVVRSRDEGFLMREVFRGQPRKLSNLRHPFSCAMFHDFFCAGSERHTFLKVVGAACKCLAERGLPAALRTLQDNHVIILAARQKNAANHGDEQELADGAIEGVVLSIGVMDEEPLNSGNAIPPETLQPLPQGMPRITGSYGPERVSHERLGRPKAYFIRASPEQVKHVVVQNLMFFRPVDTNAIFETVEPEL